MKMPIQKIKTGISGWIQINRWLLVILLLSLVFRLAFVTVFSHWDEGMMMDSNRYQRVALNINHGRGFTEWGFPTAFSPPLYPFFMAGIFKVFGSSSVPIKIIQVLLSVLTCACIYWIGNTLFGRLTGLIAAFGIAINPEIIVLAGSLYTETLYIFISCLVFAMIVYALKHPDRKIPWAIAGILMGLTILTRHILIFFPLLLLIIVWVFSSLKRFRKPLLLFNLICYLILVPWIVRHYVIFGQFVPVASGAGGGLWHGSNQSFNGNYQYKQSKKVIARETAGLNRPVDKDRTLLKKSLHSISESPAQFAMLVVKKYIQFFIQVYEDVPHGEKRERNPIVLIVLMLSYYPVLMGCIFGIFAYRKQWRILFPLHLVMLYSALIYAMTLVTPRYRIPLYPFMILFAGAWVACLLQKQCCQVRCFKNKLLRQKDPLS